MQDETGKHSALAESPNCDAPPAFIKVERAEDANLHRPSRGAVGGSQRPRPIVGLCSNEDKVLCGETERPRGATHERTFRRLTAVSTLGSNLIREMKPGDTMKSKTTIGTPRHRKTVQHQ